MPIIQASQTELEHFVDAIADFPKPGVLFRDLSPMLADPYAFKLCVDDMQNIWKDTKYDAIAGFDARGFIFGSTLAYASKKPFVMIRKAGKLPGQTARESYNLEYGSATIEMRQGFIKPGSSVLLIDDVLATGGTMKAGCNLVERLGCEVAGCHSVIEIKALQGRDLLLDYKVRTQLKY